MPNISTNERRRQDAIGRMVARSRAKRTMGPSIGALNRDLLKRFPGQGARGAPLSDPALQQLVQAQSYALSGMPFPQAQQHATQQQLQQAEVAQRFAGAGKTGAESGLLQAKAQNIPAQLALQQQAQTAMLPHLQAGNIAAQGFTHAPVQQGVPMGTYASEIGQALRTGLRTGATASRGPKPTNALEAARIREIDFKIEQAKQEAGERLTPRQEAALRQLGDLAKDPRSAEWAQPRLDALLRSLDIALGDEPEAPPSRAVMPGGRTIQLKDGRWWYEDTGEPVPLGATR